MKSKGKLLTMVERPEANPEPKLISHGSSEEEIWSAAATKYKFLGHISPVSIYKIMQCMYPKEYREEYEDEQRYTFEALLGECLEEHPRRLPFFLIGEYQALIVTGLEARFEQFKRKFSR